MAEVSTIQNIRGIYSFIYNTYWEIYHLLCKFNKQFLIRELAEEEAIRLGERVKQYRDTNNLESDKIGTILLTTLVLILLEDMIYMIFEQFNSNVNLITIIQLRRYFNFMN